MKAIPQQKVISLDPGAVHVVDPFPFVLEDHGDVGPEAERYHYKPGTRFEHYGSDGGDIEAFADGVGRMELTVVSTHKPGGRYPMRVFYLRRWIDPDGEVLGGAYARNVSVLRMTTVERFRRIASGYRWPYRVNEDMSVAADAARRAAGARS